MLTWQEFVGGWTGGIGGLLVSHPIDTIKVRHQHGHESIPSSIKSTFHHEGFHGFYKGMAFPILTAGVLNSIYFGVYANMLRYMLSKKDMNENTDHIWGVPVFMAGCYAGVVQVFFTNPVEIIKIKLQTRTGVTKVGGYVETPHTTMWDCIRGTYVTQGIRGFYRGFFPTICRDVPTAGIYIFTYVYGDFWLTQQNIGEYWSHMLAGGFAGTLSYAIVNPFDVVKTRLQADNPDCPKYHGTIDCIKKSYEQHGMSVFWRGFSLTCIRAFASNSAVFVIYELCLQLFYTEI